ncbi:TonB-dependent receptor [Erythrobacter sp. WG]|uniref:TonB-dependent receptor n=1 Tax=Erythrobacter sp. WG TaxID=2985510 RepID=UPI00226F1E48|nr:TonB-dependent receptor [Erythrobacter sp. WG]MCX9147923.1 TonB-dependent receptor [Erythrobacter sp. WG]
MMRGIIPARTTVSVIALSLAATAQAQQTTTEPAGPATTSEGEAIVVTGIRASLESVRNIRRNSDEIIDAVVAEDIAKLPDLNTAQIAARIPGVQVYRQGGEAQNVLVRGLPNFTTTYNGREIFTAETRVVALQDFPAANVAALEVYKTSAADLVEPGLAGLVNVRSRMPFDFEDGQFAGSVWGLYTRQGRKLDPNFNLLATKRWEVGDGGEFGVLINASRVEMTYLDAEISNTDFLQTFRNGPGGTLIADAGAGQAARFPDIQRLFYRSGNRVRPSVNAAIQYKPTPDIEFYLEGLWQGFRNKIDDRLLAAELFNGAQTGSLVFREGTNLVRSGTVNAPAGSLFSFQGATFNKTDTYQFAGGFKGTFDRLNLRVDIARTDSTFTGSTESVDRRWTGAPTIRFDTDRPAFEITNIDLADPSQQFFDGLFEESQRSQGDDWQFRGDLEYLVDGAFIRSIQAGVRYTDRDALRQLTGRFDRPAALTPATALPVEFDVFRGVNVGGTFRWAAPTYASIRENIAAIRQLVGFGPGPAEAATLYTASEKNLAGYGQVNLGSGDLEGTVGLRYVRVKTRVAGPVPTGIPQIDEGSTNDNWLPNASIRFRATPEIQLRAAVAKTRTLPTFADLNPALVLGPPPPGGVGTDSDPRRGGGGNPFLNPFTSWNFDAAVEWYFSPTGFISLTGFHRRIDGFIQPNTFRITDPTLGVVEITGPVNTGKGRITGAELQAQAFAEFDSLPDWARGFGVQVNVTYLDAKTEQPDGTGALTLQPITDQLNGVSRWNANVVAIYERYGASARLSYNDRSSFRATQQLRGDDIYVERARPAGRLDLSLSYNLTDDFAIFGDWTNITRERFRQDFTSARNGAPAADFVRYLRDDESTLSLGVRFRFGR